MKNIEGRDGSSQFVVLVYRIECFSFRVLLYNCFTAIIHHKLRVGLLSPAQSPYNFNF